MINLSLSQKIRKAIGKTSLDISRMDFEKEITRLYKECDRKEGLELFEAYRDWELGGRRNKSEKEAIELAKRNFYFGCIVADIRLKNKPGNNSDYAILSSAVHRDITTVVPGPIEKFYNEIISKSLDKF